MKTKFGESFTTEELEEHYVALVGKPDGLTREQLLAGLRGTAFEEHAYGETMVYAG